MVNRTLIRTKVVQMLYGYLLTQSEFRIRDIEADASADNQYAHTLSIAVMRLLLELAGRADHPGMPRVEPERAMANSPLMLSLSANAELRGIMARNTAPASAFDSCLERLHRLIADSQAYRTFTRSARGRVALTADVKFWREVMETIISQDPEFVRCARALPGYTYAGFTRAMIAVGSILDSYGLSRTQLSDARAGLQRSLDKAYELYHGLLRLPVEITRAEELRVDEARNKFMPSDAERHPDLRFLNNTFVKALADDKALDEYREEHPYDWPSQALLVDKLLAEVLASEAYKEYMARPADETVGLDAELWYRLMKTVILPSDALAEALEEQSVYWNDDLEIMGTFVLKTIRRYQRSEEESDDGSGRLEVLPQFKDDEDARFGVELFDLAVENRDYFCSLINDATRHRRWDADRLAFMDVVVMITALAEIVNFPQIPLAVSYNEYIEIAKSYSTQRSGDFINGTLNAIVTRLQEEGSLRK